MCCTINSPSEFQVRHYTTVWTRVDSLKLVMTHSGVIYKLKGLALLNGN